MSTVFVPISANRMLRILLALCMAICMAEAAGAAQVGTGDADRNGAVGIPAIVPEPGVGGFEEQTFRFAFMQEVRTVTVRAERAVYLGARNADKTATICSGTGPDDWLAGYYGSFVADPVQDALYTDLLGEFEKIRAGSGLDDDEYVELLTAFVQSLPYASDCALPRYPVETIVDGRGDCDDRSLLLAALLNRAGYGVALFYFGEANHVAVGIASPVASFLDSGYAIIETTEKSLIGVPPAGTSAEDVCLIPVSPGGKAYGGCAETLAIHRALLDAEESGNQPRYNYILAHMHDRSGTYAWLTAIESAV